MPNTTKRASPATSEATPPKPKNDLLNRLRGTPDDELGNKVERSEGVQGGVIEPIYAKRFMRCYSVTDSELKQIGLANIAITATSSIGTGFLAFALDVFKDTELAEAVPATAQVALGYVQPICIGLGVAFWVTTIALMWWRNSMVTLIKTESVDP